MSRSGGRAPAQPDACEEQARPGISDTGCTRLAADTKSEAVTFELGLEDKVLETETLDTTGKGERPLCRRSSGARWGNYPAPAATGRDSEPHAHPLATPTSQLCEYARDPGNWRAGAEQARSRPMRARGWAVLYAKSMTGRREAEVAGSHARSLAKAVRGGRRQVGRESGRCAGGEAMSRRQPGWASRAGNNGTSRRSFFPRIQRGPSGGRGAALRS
ncbi:uncharacterized protein LOC114004765 [Tupaia chinensis]|uniref:uncharacterized protein LOC114004765 n=1 Tax=Tupaia chinensis TaxID=246437 RepID=UPI000FFCB063|nr:uncharacterized protein LOC114004765 [Tupaia chinensis]